MELDKIQSPNWPVAVLPALFLQGLTRQHTPLLVHYPICSNGYRSLPGYTSDTTMTPATRNRLEMLDVQTRSSTELL